MPLSTHAFACGQTTQAMFPMIIQFMDTKKVKTVQNYEQFQKHSNQPIVVLSHSRQLVGF